MSADGGPCVHGAHYGDGAERVCIMCGARWPDDAVRRVSDALRASWDDDTYPKPDPWPDSEGLKDPDFDALALIACRPLRPYLPRVSAQPDGESGGTA